MSNQKKMGRPKLADGHAKKNLPFRASGYERKLYEVAATKAKLPLSDWIRKTLTNAAKSEIV